MWYYSTDNCFDVILLIFFLLMYVLCDLTADAGCISREVAKRLEMNLNLDKEIKLCFIIQISKKCSFSLFTHISFQSKKKNKTILKLEL